MGAGGLRAWHHQPLPEFFSNKQKSHGALREMYINMDPNIREP
jgi:hypothetical protein